MTPASPSRRRALALVLASFVLPLVASAQTLRTENVVLVTLDGLRWQELFAGADSSLLRDARFNPAPAALLDRYDAPDASSRRERLMPFFWRVIGTQGQVYGNRRLGNEADVTNRFWFSYPGYNEILSGYADERIDSNDKRPNPNRTVLEWIHEQPAFRGRVAAFGSWDVFPYIVNEERSGIPVNAGFEPARGEDLTGREAFLNELQEQVPSPWPSVRLDAFTHHYALEYLKKHRPRLLYIAYGETDDFAHDGRYDAYLDAARRTDAFIQALWEWTQADEAYRDRTTFVLTTDHGRGEGEAWTSHGRDVPGSDGIWIAVIGPDTRPLGEAGGPGRTFQNQVASTVAALLGLPYEGDRPAGEVIRSAVGR